MSQHFLLRYNRRSGHLDVKIFTGAEGRRRAMRARFDTERDFDPDVEVVVIEAANEDSLRRTHARYFRDAQQLMSDARTAAFA